jgi:magnesium transporter
MQDTTSGPERSRRPRRPRPKRSPIGASPGTLIADPAANRSELRLTLYSPEAIRVIENASMDDVLANCERWPVIWLDCVGLASIDLIRDIGKVFNLHPLALEDVVNTGQRPKTEFFGDHAFVVLRMIDDAAARRYEQMSLFFGEDYVVTFQEREGDPFDPVRKRLEAAVPGGLRSREADFLAYSLIDAIVDSYFPPVDNANDRIDRIEDEMLGAPRQDHIHELHDMRRETTARKQVLWAVRDAVAALMRTEEQCIAPDTKVYFNDTLDHVIRLIQMEETQRETITGLIELHLLLGQARTNDVVGLLTIVSTIFIPLTFLVGVWGMNFDPDASPWNMPELRAWFGYPAALGFMLAIAVALLIYFRRKKWL